MAENGDVYVIDIQAKLTNKISDGVDKAEKDADRLGKALERTQKQLDKVSKMEANLTIGADDKASASINRAKKVAEVFGRTTVRTVIEADDRASKKIQEADKEANKLRNKETKIMLTAQDKANKVLTDAKAKADKLTKQAIKMRMEAKDQASPTIDKVNKKANALTSKAEKIMLTAEDRASAIIEKATGKAKALEDHDPEVQVSAVDRASHIIGNVVGAAKSFGGSVYKATLSIVDNVTSPLKNLKNQIFSIEGAIKGLVAGVAAQQLIVNPVNLADSWEQAFIGFETMLGSTEAANSMMKDIENFAAKTPFDSAGVISAAQRLLTSGYGADEIIPILDTFGDANSGLGGTTESLEGMIRAVQQMRTAGTLNTEDINLLLDRNVPVWQYLSDYFGKDTNAIREMVEKRQISSEEGINAIMKGMEQFDGMMEKVSNRTVRGLLSNIKDTFNSKIVTKWGKGLQEGATEGFGKFVDYLDEINPLLEKAGTSLEEMGEAASKWFFGLLEGAGERLKEVLRSDEFKNAEGFDKIKVAWDKVIGDPLSQWWETKGLPMFEDYSGKIGKVIGEGLKGGVLALLGIDVEGVSSDASRIGKSFAEGFLEGFEGEKVGSAIKTAFGNLFGSSAKILPGGEDPTAGSWGSLAILTYLGSKLGVGKLVGSGLKGIGKMIANYGVKGEAAKLTIPNFFGSKTNGTGLIGMLTKFFGSYKQGTGAMGLLSKIIGSNAAGTGILGLFGKAGIALGGGTTAAGGATAGTAAMGGASIFGGILGALGIGNGAWDLFKGFTADNQEEKEKRLWRGGTKLGMVAGGAGTGALTGAAIGSLFGGVGAAPGALIGAGIGGIGTFFGGNKAGDWLRETFNKGNEKAGGSLWKSMGAGAAAALPLAASPLGPLAPILGAAIGGLTDVFGDDIKKFFCETIPEKWNELWDSVSNFFTETVPQAVSSFGEKAGVFFTETIPEKWNEFWEPIGNFFTETVPEAVSRVGEKIGAFFTETIPEKWGEFTDAIEEFVTETVPYAIGYAASSVHTFFTETLQEKWDELWENVGEFFTETLPEFKDEVIEKATTFWNETIVTGWHEFWDGVGEFFTETLPEFKDTVIEKATTFWNETIVAGWNDFWDGVGEFITETIPEAATMIWEKASNFITVTIPGKLGELWDSVTNYITETLVPGLEKIGVGVWDFITVTIPNKIGEIWEGAKTLVTETLPQGLEKIGESISTFWTETVPGWFTSLWDSAKEKWNSIKSNFSLGWSDSKDDSKGNNAHGGVVQSKMLSWLGEEGPEAVIPLNPARRDRALSLWMQTGQRLGVAAHANGGIVEGRSSGSNILYTPYYRPVEAPSDSDGGRGNRYTGLIDETVRAAITARTGGGFNVQVTIQGINFNINAGSADPEGIIAAIRANSDEFTDMMADMLESALREAFENIPKAS